MRFALASVLGLALAAAADAEDWPQWRGPSGNGVSHETGLPTTWSAGDAAWRAVLGGQGVSSPIVSGDRVFVTSQVGRGTLRPGTPPPLARGDEAKDEKPLEAGSAQEKSGKVEFLVEAFARKDGRRLWQYRAAAEGELPEVHQKHNLASASPVTDGRLVFAWFGNGQLVALDRDGRLAWQRHLGRDYGPYTIAWGAGSSPALAGELLILLCDHEPASYLLALDKRSGKERWKVPRTKGSISYSTPTLVRTASGASELVVNSTTRIDAYDPKTGGLLWWTGEPHRFAVPVPAFEDGVIYMSRGYRSGPYMAITTGGRGDVSKTHVRWFVASGAPYVSSLVYYRGLVYMANDAGVASVMDGATGERVWQQRIEGIFTASPVAGDGKVYLVSETGDTIVLGAGREERVLARNPLGERIVGSPAVAHGQIFLRSDLHLFAIGQPRP